MFSSMFCIISRQSVRSCDHRERQVHPCMACKHMFWNPVAIDRKPDHGQAVTSGFYVAVICKPQILNACCKGRTRRRLTKRRRFPLKHFRKWNRHKCYVQKLFKISKSDGLLHWTKLKLVNRFEIPPVLASKFGCCIPTWLESDVRPWLYSIRTIEFKCLFLNGRFQTQLGSEFYLCIKLFSKSTPLCPVYQSQF